MDSDDVVRPDAVENGVKAFRAGGYDAVVHGVQIHFYSNGAIDRSETLIPETERYECASRREIIENPIRYMFGTPPEEANDVLCKDRWKYIRFSWNWAWIFKADIIKKYHLRFYEDLLTHEDCLFTCEFLAHAEKTGCVQTVGYEYHKRADGAGSVYHRQVKPDQKILLVKYRRALCESIRKAAGVDIEPWAYGSYVLSLLQLCTALAGEKNGYRQWKRYLELPEVPKAIRAVPARGNPKLVIPLVLCKLHGYRLVYFLMAMLKKIGYTMR